MLRRLREWWRTFRYWGRDEGDYRAWARRLREQDHRGV